MTVSLGTSHDVGELVEWANLRPRHAARTRPSRLVVIAGARVGVPELPYIASPATGLVVGVRSGSLAQGTTITQGLPNGVPKKCGARWGNPQYAASFRDVPMVDAHGSDLGSPAHGLRPQAGHRNAAPQQPTLSMVHT